MPVVQGVSNGGWRAKAARCAPEAGASMRSGEDGVTRWASERHGLGRCRIKEAD